MPRRGLAGSQTGADSAWGVGLMRPVGGLPNMQMPFAVKESTPTVRPGDQQRSRRRCLAMPPSCRPRTPECRDAGSLRILRQDSWNTRQQCRRTNHARPNVRDRRGRPAPEPLLEIAGPSACCRLDSGPLPLGSRCKTPTAADGGGLTTPRSAVEPSREGERASGPGPTRTSRMRGGPTLLRYENCSQTMTPLS